MVIDDDGVTVWQEEECFSAEMKNAELRDLGAPTLELFYADGVRVDTPYGYEYHLGRYVLDWDIRRTFRCVFIYG